LEETAMGESSGGGLFRRRAGCLLAGLGAFLLVTGILLRTYVYDHVAVVPADAHAITTLRATGATYFDPARLTTRKGLRVTAISTLRGDVSAARGDTEVFDTFLAVQAYDGTPIQFVQSRLALDRHSGRLVWCCGAHIGGNHLVRESGISVKFPFFSRKTTYPVFDADVARPVPAAYTGEETLDGIRVYRYVQVLPATQIGTRRVPPSVLGLPSRPELITVRRIEATTMTFWVEPVTGVPMKIEENTRQILQTRSKRHTLVVFAADLRQRPSEVAASVRRYRSQSVELNLVHNVLPLVNAIGGALLIPFGAVLACAPRRRASVVPVSDGALETGAP